jgi:hypothetical protein
MLYSNAARMPAAARMTPKQGSSPDNTKERVKAAEAAQGMPQSKALHGYTQAKSKAKEACKSRNVIGRRDTSSARDASSSKDARNHNGRLSATAGTPTISSNCCLLWIFKSYHFQFI